MSLERKQSLKHRQKRKSFDLQQQDNYQYHQFLKVISKVEKRVLQLHLKNPTYPQLLQNYEKIFEVYDSLSSEFLMKLQFKGLDGLGMVFHRLLAGMKLIQNQFLKTTFEIYRKNVYIAGDEEFIKQIKFEEMSDKSHGINQNGSYKKYLESSQKLDEFDQAPSKLKEDDNNMIKIVQQDGSIIEVNNENFNYNFYISRVLGKKNDILDNAQYSRCKQLMRRILLNLVQTQQQVQQAVEFEENMAEIIEDELEQMDDLKKDVGMKRRQEGKGKQVVDQCVGCNVLDFGDGSNDDEQQIERDRQMGLIVEANYKLKKLEFKFDMVNKENETLKKNLELSQQRVPQMEMAIRNFQMQIKNLEGSCKESKGLLDDTRSKHNQLEQKLAKKKQKLKGFQKERESLDEEMLAKEMELKQQHNIAVSLNAQLKKSNERIKDYIEQINKLNNESSRLQKNWEEKTKIKDRIIKELQVEVNEEKKKREAIMEKDSKGKRAGNKDNNANSAVNTNKNNTKSNTNTNSNNNNNNAPNNENNNNKPNEIKLQKKQSLSPSPQKEKSSLKSNQNIAQQQKQSKKQAKQQIERCEIGIQIELRLEGVDQESQAELRKECSSKGIQVGKKESLSEEEQKELDKLRKKENIFIELLSQKEIEIAKMETQLKSMVQKVKEEVIIEEEKKQVEQNDENQRIVNQLNDRIKELETVGERANKRKNQLKKKNKQLFEGKQAIEDELSKLQQEVLEIQREGQENRELYIAQLEEIDRLREVIVGKEKENLEFAQQIGWMCKEKDEIQKQYEQLNQALNQANKQSVENINNQQISENQEKGNKKEDQKELKVDKESQTFIQTANQIIQTEFQQQQQQQQKEQQLEQQQQNQQPEQIQQIEQIDSVQQVQKSEEKQVSEEKHQQNQQQQVEKKDAEVQTITIQQEESSTLSLLVKKNKQKGKNAKNDYYFSLKQHTNSNNNNNNNNNSGDFDNTIDGTENYSLLQRQQKEQSKSKIFNFSYEEQQPRYSYPKLLTDKYLPPMENTQQKYQQNTVNYNNIRTQNYSAMPLTMKSKLQKQLNFSELVHKEYLINRDEEENEEELLEIYNQLSKSFEKQKLMQLRKQLFPEIKTDFIKESRNKIKSEKINDLINIIRNEKTSSIENSNIKQQQQEQQSTENFPKYTEFRIMMHEMKQKHKEKCGENCPHLEKFYRLIKEANENSSMNNHNKSKGKIIGIQNINKLPGVFLKKSQYQQLIGNEKKQIYIN